jgi:hypothetical protein
VKEEWDEGQKERTAERVGGRRDRRKRKDRE